MSVKEIHSDEFSTYFCTFTCYKWLNLFEIAKSHRHIYQWFELLQQQSIDVIGYVIMPNHLHCILHFNNKKFSLNKTIANAKRFMAYNIISHLKKDANLAMLEKLSQGCTARDRRKGQLHGVFEPSFDAKPIFSDAFMDQKLNYIHHNPVSGKWLLVNDYHDYVHSSASFYESGKAVYFTPRHYLDI
ncbi:MAG: hypothetical protein EOO88_34490 [Pedobacter sp.]|nr:MAG: hypothetical protein EOO88_34490 [Pedobacter sp.]